MAETKQIRIPQAATKFGVGASTIVDFLKGKGHAVTPATRLTDDMFDLLAKEFQQDAALKDKAAHIEIGSASRGTKDQITLDDIKPESKKKDEEQEVFIKSSNVTTEVKFDKKEKEVKKEEETTPEEPEVKEKKTTLTGPKVVGKVDVE